MKTFKLTCEIILADGDVIRHEFVTDDVELIKLFLNTYSEDDEIYSKGNDIYDGHGPYFRGVDNEL